MSKTVVALYDDIVVARQVVEDLVKEGFPRNSISLITNDAQNEYSHYLDEDYTPKEDAVSAVDGAGFGALIGVLTGTLVGLASLTIPGIGLVVVAGPIAAGLTGALAGAVTGGVAGALIKSGVPEDDAPYYAEGIRRGGTLISVKTSNTLVASDIINRYGAINIHERSSQWRQDGWDGSDPVENEDQIESDSSVFIMSDTTTTRVTHVSHNTPGLASVEEDPSVSESNPEAVQPFTVPITDMIRPEFSPPEAQFSDSSLSLVDESSIDDGDTREGTPISNESSSIDDGDTREGTPISNESSSIDDGDTRESTPISKES